MNTQNLRSENHRTRQVVVAEDIVLAPRCVWLGGIDHGGLDAHVRAGTKVDALITNSGRQASRAAPLRVQGSLRCTVH